MIIENIPKIIIEPLTSIHDNRKAFVLTQDVPWQLVQKEIDLKNPEVSFFEGIVTEELLKEMSKRVPSGIEVVYGIGGGATIDVAKYVASAKNLELIAVPTIISNDSFIAYETAVRREGVVTYIKTKQADIIYADLDLISKAPKRMNVCGSSDVLSIFTGSFDWKYANQRGVAKEDEIFDQAVYEMATSILKAVEHYKHDIRKCDKTGLKKILDLLCMETRLNNNYGNARPEEGSEHFFTYAIEKYTGLTFLHGEMVALGILLMSHLQGQDYEQMKDLMDYIGIKFRETGASKNQIVETLLKLKTFVKKYNFRYSIANELMLSPKQAETIVSDALS
jgi:glycerol-1-phosphate dehydrogenase [NAD(P)+]